MTHAFPLQSVINQLCNMALYEKDRLRVISLKVLTDTIPNICQNDLNPANSNAIRKNVFPCLTQILLGSSSTKGDLRVAACETLKEIQRCCPMGEKVWMWVNDSKQQEELKKCVGAH